MDAEARALAELAPVIDETSLHGALAPLDRARRCARDARARAFRETGTPRTAAWASALAAGVAGREAAWSCAGAAAWAAARIAVGDMAGDRARAAARSAARRCGRSDRRTGRGADALAPTLATLAESVIALLDRMLPTETVTIPATAQAPEAVFTTSV